MNISQADVAVISVTELKELKKKVDLNLKCPSSLHPLSEHLRHLKDIEGLD